MEIFVIGALRVKVIGSVSYPTWMLGIELWSSRKVASTLNY